MAVRLLISLFLPLLASKRVHAAKRRSLKMEGIWGDLSRGPSQLWRLYNGRQFGYLSVNLPQLIFGLRLLKFGLELRLGLGLGLKQ